MDKITLSLNGQWQLIEDSIESFAKTYVQKYATESLSKSEISLFKRYEDKYIIHKSMKKQLIEALDKNLSPDYPDKKTKFNVMKSIYFDSAGLDMVKHHLSKASSRFKIRTREYAPNGNLTKSDFTYLEVKAKHDNVSDKFRIKVPNDDMRTFKKGLPVTPSVKLIKANSHIGIADLMKRITDINEAMQKFNMRPSCEVSYTRRAYSDNGGENGLRVTVDEGIDHNIVDNISSSVSDPLVKESSEDSLSSMLNGYDPNSHLIVEIKHHGSIPDWLNKFLIENNIAKTNFSKYCYSIAKHLNSNKKPHV